MTRFYRKPFLAVLAAALLAALFVPAAAGAGPAATRTYIVTVENLTAGQPFTPPVAVTHKRNHDLFVVGAAASPGIQGVAENGDVPGLVAEQASHPRVGTVTVGDAAGPVLPGSSVSFEIEAVPGRRWLSVASMLICTNDGFTGVNDLRLPQHVGDTTTHYGDGYDAGTEINTEEWKDLVPPCAPLTGFDNGGEYSGMSDPTLAEGGVIAHHPGIAGTADLSEYPHDWADPVVKISVTRVD